MSEVTLQDIAVAIARMETKQDAMMKQLEELTKTTDQHWKKIGELETKLALLEQRQEIGRASCRERVSSPV